MICMFAPRREEYPAKLYIAQCVHLSLLSYYVNSA